MSRFRAGSSSSRRASERATATPDALSFAPGTTSERRQSTRRKELTSRMSVGMICRIARPSESTPAMRAPSMGRRIAADQKRRRVWGKGRKPEARLVSAVKPLAEDRSCPGRVEMGGDDQLVRRVRVLAARDDVLGGAAEEEEAEEVAARVEVEVEGRRREQEEREAGDGQLDRRSRWRRRRGRRGAPRRAAPGDGRRWARSRPGGRRRAGGRPWRSRHGARRRCPPGGGSYEQSSSMVSSLGSRRVGWGSGFGSATSASPARLRRLRVFATARLSRVWMRRVGIEPTSPFEQWILNPSPLPVWTPPQGAHSHDATGRRLA